jgi:ABC-type branched-subunit amino acid transport system permease subunit
MYIGALLGWLVGWYVGYLYVEYFEPVYLSDFSGLNEIMCWDRLRYIFAGAGVFAGAAIGAAVTFCISLKASNYKSGDGGEK